LKIDLIIIVGTWFAFKYAFRNKAAKMERTDLNYGALARVTRDGGFLVLSNPFFPEDAILTSLRSFS
jgi:hypothetical protein